MKNADLSAYPTCANDQDPAWAAANIGGLTKRETFAMAAMQAIISNPSLIGSFHKDAVDYLKVHSVVAADAVLSELEKTNEP